MTSLRDQQKLLGFVEMPNPSHITFKLYWDDKLEEGKSKQKELIKLEEAQNKHDYYVYKINMNCIKYNLETQEINYIL